MSAMKLKNKVSVDLEYVFNQEGVIWFWTWEDVSAFSVF